jgi:hypothetical protein
MFYQAIGVFIGVFINASIFAELRVIYFMMGREQKSHQKRIANAKSAMVHLGLPERVKLNVRLFINRYNSSAITQLSMQHFTKIMPRSMNLRLKEVIYSEKLIKNLKLKDIEDPKLLSYLLHLIKFQFKQPEDIVIDQSLDGKIPPSGNHLYFINVGYVNVFVNVTLGHFKQIGIIKEGHFFGEQPLLFNTASRYRVECSSF